jgi:hypothetical protein
MTATFRFCENLGGGLNPGVRFCSAYAASVKAAPSPPATGAARSSPVAGTSQQQLAVHPPMASQQAIMQRPAASEPVLGIIPRLLRRKDLLGMDAEYWTLIVTPLHPIVAEMPNKMGQTAMAEDHRDATRIGWAGVIALKYRAMAPSVALGQSSRNWAEPLSQVRKVDVHADSESRGDDMHIDIDHLTIEMAGGKLDWVMTGGNACHARQVLWSAVGSLVR